METLIFIAIVLVLLVVSSFRAEKERRVKTLRRLKNEYEQPLNRKLEHEDYERLKAYFKDLATREIAVIDEDTWDDLNMDAIFMEINNTNSSMGREYLYALLRRPQNEEFLRKLDELCENFHANENIRLKIQEELAHLGYARGISVYQYLKNIMELGTKSNVLHYLELAFLLVSMMILFFVRPDIGIILFVAALGVSVIMYFREKARVESYFQCVKWIVGMIHASKVIGRMNIPFENGFQEELREIYKKVGKISKNIYLMVSGNNMAGSILEIALDYMRILTHVDLIKFNKVLKEVQKYQDELIRMYEILGLMESAIAVAAYRNKLPMWCKPQLKKGWEAYEVTELYHPLLDNPIPNSIKAKECVLLTGSNASGKSTFLKAVAINALLSQTIYTSTSKEYHGDYYRIVSSMSHRDDILNGDSYYMVEIKALKRIMELADNTDDRLLCFLDEVLRGTNTVERIAASTQILRSFPIKGALCFAATHDIELTKLLDDVYDNYHFDESFENNDVKYNYNLKRGPAVTRNAIKLLAQTGYDEELIKDAVRMTEIFEEKGIWQTGNISKER